MIHIPGEQGSLGGKRRVKIAEMGLNHPPGPDDKPIRNVGGGCMEAARHI
jgi:hypothetical protein